MAISSTAGQWSGIQFRTSTYSNDDCVGVAESAQSVGVTDTKGSNAPVLEFCADSWTTFVSSIKG